MIRAQIYLTEIEKQILHKFANESGKSQSELIREAIDYYIEARQKQAQDKLSILRKAKGLWAHRDDLPDFSELRKEFDERIEES